MNAFLTEALLPFQFAFMQNAFVITLVIAAPMALISCLLVLKGWSLMGDAISHAVLPGVVVAYILNLPLVFGAFAAGMFCALATGFLNANSRVKEDTVMGVVFSGMFGLGLVLYVGIRTNVHLDHILFGDMLGVSYADIALTGAVAAASLAFVLLKRRDLVVFCFDQQHGRAIGLPMQFLHYGLLAAISLVVVGALKAVGIILAVAMLVAPGAIAYLLTRRFAVMMVLALTIALVSSFAGIYASFFIDSAPAPTIVLIMTGLFVSAFIWHVRQANIAGRRVLQAAPETGT
ncbi:MAG: metal ABC transporter permease [Nitratireductor sp.]|nr:metal ABC transporter permease [Nitratireductor sp.]